MLSKPILHTVFQYSVRLMVPLPLPKQLKCEIFDPSDFFLSSFFSHFSFFLSSIFLSSLIYFSFFLSFFLSFVLSFYFFLFLFCLFVSLILSFFLSCTAIGRKRNKLLLFCRRIHPGNLPPLCRCPFCGKAIADVKSHIHFSHKKEGFMKCQLPFNSFCSVEIHCGQAYYFKLQYIHVKNWNEFRATWNKCKKFGSYVLHLTPNLRLGTLAVLCVPSRSKTT